MGTCCCSTPKFSVVQDFFLLLVVWLTSSYKPKYLFASAYPLSLGRWLQKCLAVISSRLSTTVFMVGHKKDTVQWPYFKNALQALEGWDKLYKKNRCRTTAFNLAGAGWNPYPLSRAMSYHAHWAKSTIFHNFKFSGLVNTWTSVVGTHICLVPCLPLVTTKLSHLKGGLGFFLFSSQ